MKGLEEEPIRSRERYTNSELLNYLKVFYDKNGIIPGQNDFANNPKYPNYGIYRKRFGSWNNALILTGLKGLKKEIHIQQRTNGVYNDTNTCDRCRDEGIETKLVPGKAYREKDKDGKKTGRWQCDRCYYKYHNNLPDSYHNIMKSLANCRTGNQNPNSEQAKGDNFEELTHQWKGVKILSKENDCCNGPLDHSVDSEGKVPQTKGKLYDSYNQCWKQNFTNEHNAIANGFDFDYLILYCASKDGKIIERIYEFPVEEVLKRTGVTIVKNPSKGVQWYEKYRIIDEETIKQVNEIWKYIIDEIGGNKLG